LCCVDGIVVAANYNRPGQLVTQEKHCCRGSLCCDERGGRKTCFVTTVGGAFHSPMMEPAREELAAAIATTFSPYLSGIKQQMPYLIQPKSRKI
jgi:[acyl-carrier-protein] S-malonyltransferase